MVRVKIRGFTFPSDFTEQHSFIVGTSQGGLTLPLGTIEINEETTVLGRTRPLIELIEHKGMTRRNIIFQEFLHLITISPNPHRWPKDTQQTYWLGYYESPDQEIPHLISNDGENQLVSNYINMKTSKITGDLIIIPQSQIGPVCGKCCKGCDLCPPVSSTIKNQDKTQEIQKTN